MRTRVEERIRMVVERMDKLTYIFEDLTGANLRLDGESLPAFVNVLPVSGSIMVTPTQVKHFPKCAFWFVDKVNLDADGDDIQAVVERCIDYAYEFILWLNESKMFEPIENNEVSMTVITSDFDSNVAGVAIEVQLKEKNGLRLCHDMKPSDYFDDRQG